MKKTGGVLKTLRPGDAGTERLVKRFGERLIAVRYRGNPARRVRSTTVEIVVDEGFWMPHHRSLDDELRCLNMDTQVNTLLAGLWRINGYYLESAHPQNSLVA